MMAGGRPTLALFKKDTVTGNWTVTPSPDPTPRPSGLPVSSGPAGHAGPPYALTAAVMGGVPTVTTDVPITAVLLAFFLASAAAHMTILQLNKRAGLRFLFSGMMFALCLLRSVALIVRIAWAAYPRAADVAIAAGVLAQTGSVLILVVDLVLTQRVVRAYHAAFGWHRATTAVFHLLAASVVVTLLGITAVTVQGFFAIDASVRRADRLVQLIAGTYMAFLAFAPIPIVLLAALVPRAHHVEKFGAGRWRTKVGLLLFASAVATLGAAFRVATGFVPRPPDDPAWYHSRACYYCFNFVTDLAVSAVYLLARFDRRFIVPDGAKGPGDYGKGMRKAQRPAALTRSSSGEEGNDTDPEILAKLRGTGNEDYSLKRAPPPVYDGKGKGKGMGMNVNGAYHYKRSSDDVCGSRGEWNGLPWPPPVPWWIAARHSASSVPTTATPSCDCDMTDVETPVNYSPVDGLSGYAFGGFDGTSSCQGSTKWGGETSSSTCIQEPELTYTTTPRHFHPHQLQNGQRHTFGQGRGVDDETPMSATTLTEDSVVWPFTSLTNTTNGDAESDVRSSTYSRASSIDTPSPGRSSRSQSTVKTEEKSVHEGWV